MLVVYQQLVTYFYGPPPTVSPPEVEKSKPETGEPRQDTTVAPPSVARATPDPAVASVPGKEVSVETENYTAVFTSAGARLKSFKFKKYRSSVDEKSPPFEMVRNIPGVPLPLGVRWQAASPVDDSDIIYSVQGNDLKLAGDSTKSFTFFGATYPIQMERSVKGAEGGAPSPEILLTDQSDHSVPNHDAPFEGFIALVDNKIRREAPAEVAKGHEFTGDVSWAGFGHTYFFFALLPENGAQHKVSVRHAGEALIGAIGGQHGTLRYTVFIGP